MKEKKEQYNWSILWTVTVCTENLLLALIDCRLLIIQSYHMTIKIWNIVHRSLLWYFVVLLCNFLNLTASFTLIMLKTVARMFFKNHSRKKKAIRFWTPWGCVNDDRILIFGWTITLKHNTVSALETLCLAVFLFFSRDNTRSGRTGRLGPINQGLKLALGSDRVPVFSCPACTVE